MSFDKHQFRELIADTLEEIGLYSEDAVNLLMGTAAQESGFGTYLKQLKNGPALGVFQMEPTTFKDILEKYLKHKKNLYCRVYDALGYDFVPNDPELLVYNLKFAIIMARIHYRRVPEPLPNDLSGYAKYYKKYYNTHLGKGTEEEFIRNYKEYVL